MLIETTWQVLHYCHYKPGGEAATFIQGAKKYSVDVVAAGVVES